jgi:hypothetical protein
MCISNLQRTPHDQGGSQGIASTVLGSTLFLALLLAMAIF